MVKTISKCISLQITCPNVLLDPSKWINVRICLLGFHLRSRLLKAQFPLQVEEKFRVERVIKMQTITS